MLVKIQFFSIITALEVRDHKRPCFAAAAAAAPAGLSPPSQPKSRRFTKSFSSISHVLWRAQFASEAGQEHYTKGGKVGYAPQVLKFLPASIVKAEPSEKAVITELKNGRLAMIGMASLYAANKIPDSVRFLTATFGQ